MLRKTEENGQQFTDLYMIILEFEGKDATKN